MYSQQKIYAPMNKSDILLGVRSEGRNQAYTIPLLHNTKVVGTLLGRDSVDEGEIYRFIALDKDTKHHPELDFKTGPLLDSDSSLRYVYTPNLSTFLDAYNTFNVIPL